MKNKISNNYDKDFKAKILWTNSPIKFDVIQYMSTWMQPVIQRHGKQCPADIKGICAAV